jgi:hypothetical protein
MVWDIPRQDWEITRDSYSEYDHAGNQTRIFSREYKYYPEKVTSTHETRYYYKYYMGSNYFKQTGYYYRELDYENGIERIYENTCDQDTVTHYSSCRYYEYFSDNDSFSENKVVVNDQTDDLGHLLWTSTWTIHTENRIKEEFYDSTVYHYAAPSQDLPVQLDYFQRKSYEDYRLVRQEKREFIYDEFNHLIADKTYQKLPQEDWEILYEFLYILDSSGNQNGSVFLDYSYPPPHFRNQSLSSTEITGEGEITIVTKFNWDYERNEWIPSSKDGYIGRENGYYTIYWNNWDKDLEQFNNHAEEWLIWTEDDSGHKNIIHKKGKDLSTQIEFDYIREQGWTYRCNGDIDLAYDLIAEGIPEYEFQNRRIHYLYFDLAECEEGQPAAQITIFPNPCPGILNIYAEGRLGLTSILITDEMGRQIYKDERELTNFTLIDLEELRIGMYYLQLNNGAMKYSGKFILTR